MNNAPSPELFFQTINAYHRTEALKSAIELGVFGAIADGNKDVCSIARRTEASEKGIRVLCDFLTVHGFLVKQDSLYALTPDSAVFLDPKSKAYVGSAISFLLNPALRDGFSKLTDAVRRGGAADRQLLAPDHPAWVDFARTMAPLTMLAAGPMVEAIPGPDDRKLKVLDVAACHGLFGLAVARRFPNARIFAQDWPKVLEVARENARAQGLQDRIEFLPGSIFDVELGSGYDIVLLTNILHHFDPATNETLLARVREAMAPGALALTLEFVPDENRITPPPAATFSLIMLADTPAGDAYTFSELERMFRTAGFASTRRGPSLPNGGSILLSNS